MHEKNAKGCDTPTGALASRLNDQRCPRQAHAATEELIIVDDDTTQTVIDTDPNDDSTSNIVSSDDDGDGDGENISSESFDDGEPSQPTLVDISANMPRHTLNDLLNSNQNVNITFAHAETIIETTRMTNEQIIAQTMALLASKHRHERSANTPPTENEILSFVGPCPLYSLDSSFGLDMHHGVSNFPCRDVLANGGGHQHAHPLWQHLTCSHNLNFVSSSLLISELLVHGYSTPSGDLFGSSNAQALLRTTPRYSIFKQCPLSKYGVYGVRRAHGTRLCSGFTCNTNIYPHLISFHKMTHEASLRLARAIAVHDKQFRFGAEEVLVNEPVKVSQGSRRSLKRLSGKR